MCKNIQNIQCNNKSEQQAEYRDEIPNHKKDQPVLDSKKHFKVNIFHDDSKVFLANFKVSGKEHK